MNFLSDLYKTTYEGCTGCKILNKNLPVHSIMDYKDFKQADILFVSDSFKINKYGDVNPFDDEESDLILDVLKASDAVPIMDKIQYTASVKCPKIRLDDISKADKDICRKHIFDTLETVKPKLVFACGNLPLVMLTKKTGIEQKRGRSIPLTLESGHECVIVPVYHPFQVIIEPKNRYLFETDIQNAINEFIFKKNSEASFSYTLVDTIDKLRNLNLPLTEDGIVAVDIETEGLNFLTQKILTVSLSFKSNGLYTNCVIPLNHKESKFNEQELGLVLEELKRLFAAPCRKVLHNAKFDLKFFRLAGITDVQNVWDTKVMQHLVDENLPKSLKDLVNYYFPHEIKSDANSN